jgi:hypothetical protein
MPETTPYLYLGLAVTAVIMFALIGSMVLRWRNLQRDLKTLEQLDDSP